MNPDEPVPDVKALLGNGFYLIEFNMVI
jgi:hypothetical protein